MMKKSYEGHEIVYRRMRKEGLLTWGQKDGGTTAKSCHPESMSFLKDVLSQPWAPKGGRAIELGCGTGPILRWVCKRGFCGLGIDISKTAIAMAKEQSQGLDIVFRQGDVCHLNTHRLGTFDLAVDGHCFHCLTATKDRIAYLDNVFKMLKNGGLFVLLAMCGPMDKESFHAACKGHKIVKQVVYVPCEDKRYENLTIFHGKSYLPTRYIGHWKDILGELNRAGFKMKLMRYNTHNRNDFCGTLTVGVIK